MIFKKKKFTKIHFLKSKYRGRIMDTAGMLPEDMPAVLLLAQDKHAFKLMREYANMLELDGDSKGADQARKDATTILMWQKTGKVKAPD